MPGFVLLSLRVVLFAGLFLIGGAVGLSAQEKVGVKGAVNPQATGTAPGATARRLVIGQDVVFNERIVTDAQGQTQLLFVDESSMSVGPNSDLTIDQFVYDPKSGTGKMAMSATRGLLRYVGGKLSKQDEAVTLRTSTATLAVRGGAFIANILPGGKLVAIFIYGKGLTIIGVAGGSQTLTRPGFFVTVNPGGQPSPPAPISGSDLAALVAQLDGRAGGTGGATTTPSDDTVVTSGVTQTISGDVTQSVTQSSAALGTALVNPLLQAFNSAINPTAVPVPSSIPGSGTGDSATGVSGLGNVSLAGISTVPQSPGPQIVDCAITNTCPPGTPVVGTATTASGQVIQLGGGPTVPPTPPPPVTITFAGRVKNTNGNGTARGFFDQTANGDVAYTNGMLSNGTFNATTSTLGTFSFPLPAGSSKFTNGLSSTFGSFSGTAFLSGDGSFFYASILPASQPGQRLFIFGGLPASSVLQPTGSTRILAFNVQPDAALQSSIPFIRAQQNPTGAPRYLQVSPLLVAAPPSTAIGNATTASAARGLQASLEVNGTGANQQSTIAVTTGTFAALQSGQPVFNGQLRGSSMQSASGTPTQISSAVSSTVDGAGNSIYGTNSAISGFVLNQTQFNETSAGSGVVSSTPVIPSTASEVALSGSATTYGFTQPVLPAAAPSGTGAARTTQTLTGNFGGLMYTTAQTNPYVVTGSTSISTDAANNQIQATLDGSAQPSSIGPSASGVSTLTMQYGGSSGANNARGAFIDNSTFAAVESQASPQQVNGTNLPQGGKLYLVSSSAAGAPTSILPSGVSYCQCQYLQWGYWGGDLATGTVAGSDPARIDGGHINTWVAGVPTPLGDINTLMQNSSSFTYNGHAIGSVFNNGSSYLAAGGFSGQYNFGNQTGSMTISNFDGNPPLTVPTGSAPLTGANKANYSFAAGGAGIKGAINGTFYGPMAAETGGSFAFQRTVGPTYLASGIFAGKR